MFNGKLYRICGRACFARCFDCDHLVRLLLQVGEGVKSAKGQTMARGFLKSGGVRIRSPLSKSTTRRRDVCEMGRGQSQLLKMLRVSILDGSQ